MPLMEPNMPSPFRPPASTSPEPHSGAEPTPVHAPAHDVYPYALAMASAGYHVAPVRITLKVDGKKHADFGGASWDAVSTTDPRVITSWFGPTGTHRSAAGWSYVIDAGKSGVVVVDLDTGDGKDGTKKDGPAAWTALGLPGSIMSVLTRSGGFHGYYRADPAVPVYNSRSAVADGVDVRGIGGCVFGPGSFVQGHPEQAYSLLAGSPTPVAMLPVAPAVAMEAAAAARGKGQRISSDLVIQPQQALANLLRAAQEMRDTLIGYGLNTSIWRLGAEAGQYGAALEADEDVVLAWVHEQVRAHPQISELDDDDHRAARRGVEAGYAKPWQFFSLRDLIEQDFSQRGLALPSSAQAQLEPGYQPRAYFTSAAEIRERPRGPELVAGVIDAGSLGLVFGAPGSAKSFVALDMAACITTGTTWQGRAVTPGRMAYIAAEGATGTAQRLAAWDRVHGHPRGVAEQVLIRDEAVNLNDPVALRELIEQMTAVGFAGVVVDTWARCTVGVEENSSKDTGVIVANLQAVQRCTGATVIVVHHTAKEGTEPRGSGALIAATDWSLRVEKKGRAVTVTNHRQKDRDDGETLADLVLTDDLSTGSAVLRLAAPAADRGKWNGHDELFRHLFTQGVSTGLSGNRFGVALQTAGRGRRNAAGENGWAFMSALYTAWVDAEGHFAGQAEENSVSDVSAGQTRFP